MSSVLDRLATQIERLGAAARLNDLALFMKDGEEKRAQKIRAVLEHLDPGVYLIGTGSLVMSNTANWLVVVSKGQMEASMTFGLWL